MNTPFTWMNANTMMKDFSELNAKIINGAKNLTEIEKIDVGTAPSEIVYEEDKLRLHRYKPAGKITCGVPVLVVYALVNRPYMLDLQPDRSIIRNLLQHGLDVYIIDWGYPTKSDMYLTLDDYINGYLNNCVDFVRKASKKSAINIMGICQGGTFSTMYSAIYPEKIKNLVTLVTPIDFSSNDGLLLNWAKNMDIDSVVDTYRVVPGDFLNAGFLMMSPFTLNIRKYVDMLDLFEDKEKLLNFLRMEKWIFDSPGQAGECMRQFIKDCYQGNKLVKGELMVGERQVNLKNITMPLLNIFANADHIVPPSQTTPLNDLVGTKDKTLYEFKGGHIGVFVGSKSQKELAPAVAQWLHDRDDKPQPASATTTKAAPKPAETAASKPDMPIVSKKIVKTSAMSAMSSKTAAPVSAGSDKGNSKKKK